MTDRAVLSAVVVALLVAGGCVRRQVSSVEVVSGEMSRDLRSATNLPQQFTVVIPAATPGDCPPQLRDPGLHATLRLERSVMRQVSDSTAARYRATGDYSVEPNGLYGEEEGEGLRVDCSRLRAIGVVAL
ncbi:MAG TPA: hypothetical protein VK933_00495 [Longimicrobiales bacterium]|nr:hypothetical protein [Longimicrobiales bacterium]